MHEVAVALECRVDVEKVTRCSDPGSQMADALSKAEFDKFKEVSHGHGYEMNSGKAVVPEVLIEWIYNPKYDATLGNRILAEMKNATSLLGFD